MEIEVANRQRRVKVDGRRLGRQAHRALEAVGYTPDAPVGFSLTLVSDRAIARLHARHFGDPNPTNVISFPAQAVRVGRRPKGYLGDVVIGASTAARDALEAGEPPERELAFLMVHGLLHLLGHDHVGAGARGRTQRRRMERWELRLMKAAWGADGSG